MQVTSLGHPYLPRRLISPPETQKELVDTLVSESLERADQAKSNYNKEWARRSVERAVIGGALGTVLLGGAYNMPHGYVIGPLFGVGVGLYTAWEGLHRQQTGTVKVTHDGQESERDFYGHPSKVAMTAEEVQFKLLAEGQASPSRVLAFNGQAPEPAPEKLAPWKEQAPALKKLAEERRLVADFGQKTPDGQTALHLVDGLTAARLAANGQSVYAVNAGAPKDVEHSLTLVGFNVAHSESNSEDYRYLQREVDYTLTQLKTPEDLAGLAQAQGVPEGMFGLLEGVTKYGEILNYGNFRASGETYSPEFGNKPIRRSDRSSWEETLRVEDRRLNYSGGLTTRFQMNFPALLGLGGTAAGLMTAMAITGPGVPGPALMAATIGFLGGRAIGRAINSR